MDTALEIDNLLDSEHLAIEAVFREIQASSERQQRDVNGFVTEVLDRFAKIGFLVDVRMFTDETGPEAGLTWYPKIIIMGRTEAPGEFDHEQMGHEVRSNLRDLPGQDASQPVTVSPGYTSTASGLVVPE